MTEQVKSLDEMDERDMLLDFYRLDPSLFDKKGAKILSDAQKTDAVQREAFSKMMETADALKQANAAAKAAKAARKEAKATHSELSEIAYKARRLFNDYVGDFVNSRDAAKKKAKNPAGTKPTKKPAKPPRPLNKRDAADVDRADSEGMGQPQEQASKKKKKKRKS